MKTLTKKRLSLLLLSSLLLEGCQTKDEQIVAEEKTITSEDISEIFRDVETSSLDDSCKEIFYQLKPVLQDIQYVDKDYLKENIKQYKEESCFQKNGIETISTEEYASFHDLLHLLGKDENEFLSDGIISIIEREYTGFSVYPFEQSIVLMLIDLYGKDTVIRSFTTEPKELKEKISSTTDPAFADILYSYFDDYSSIYETKTDDFHVKGKKKMIVAMMESLYHNKYGKETEIPENLLNLTKEPELLNETKNYFNEEDLILNLQSNTNQKVLTKTIKK